MLDGYESIAMPLHHVYFNVLSRSTIEDLVVLVVFGVACSRQSPYGIS